jgi:hypothetical protein
MQTLINFFLPPPEVLFMFALMLGALGLMLTLVARAAAKAATLENGKNLAVETGKIAAKTAGKVAWRMFRTRMGI